MKRRAASETAVGAGRAAVSAQAESAIAACAGRRQKCDKVLTSATDSFHLSRGANFNLSQNRNPNQSNNKMAITLEKWEVLPPLPSLPAHLAVDEYNKHKLSSFRQEKGVCVCVFVCA